MLLQISSLAININLLIAYKTSNSSSYGSYAHDRPTTSPTTLRERHSPPRKQPPKPGIVKGPEEMLKIKNLGGIQKESLYRLGLQVEITECVGKVPSNYHGSLCSLGMRVLSPECVDKAPYYPGFHGDHHDNLLLTKKTEPEPIIQETRNRSILLLTNIRFFKKNLSCWWKRNRVLFMTPIIMYEDEEVCLPDVGESLVIQRALNVHASKTDNDLWLRNNIFHIKCTSKGKVGNMIIDGGSC
nr:zf-CCHC domain-containing protein [Tanacetum cinerariifolium]